MKRMIVTALLLMSVAMINGNVIAAEPTKTFEYNQTWDVSLADFPRIAGEEDDAPRLQRAVDATGAERVLYLPRGIYTASKTIYVTNSASLLLHKSATIRAVAKMDHLLHIDMSKGSMWQWGGIPPTNPFDQGLFLRGGHLDGNGLASCLYLQMYFHFSLRDVVFVNGFPYGLHVGPKGAEIIANNLYFRTMKRGLAGNVALFSEGNDSQYSDLVCVDYTVGLRTKGGANTFTRFHVWGGPIPPKEPGRLPEMLENSVCFDLGGHFNTLRDCYADTGAIGFNVSGWAQTIVGCWYLNNPAFGLKDITVVRQEADSTDLQISDCIFRSTGIETKIYQGPGRVKWRDMRYGGEFAPGSERYAEIICEPDCPQAKCADEWELITDSSVGTFSSPAGEFVKTQTARALTISVPRKQISRRFPNAGVGSEVVMRVRATDDVTKVFEFSIVQADGKIWGKHIPITREWQEVRIPFLDLKYFSHYSNMPKLKQGELPDARKITSFRFMYGNWLCNGTGENAHGFEIGSLRVVGRDKLP